MLPTDPLLRLAVLVRVDGEAELVLRVVVPREVEQDGDALEDGEAVAVVVDDGGDAAVGVEGRIPRLLLRVLRYVDALPGVLQTVGGFELLEQDGDLDTVGGGEGQELDAGFGDEAGWFGAHGFGGGGVPGLGLVLRVGQGNKWSEGGLFGAVGDGDRGQCVD